MKKIFAVLLTITMAFTVFAQKIGMPTGLTDSDVSAFAKNYDKIYAEIGNGESFQNYETFSNEDVEKMTKILNKYGITGKNATDKMNAITNGYTSLMFEQASSSNLTTSLMMKSLSIDPAGTLRMMVAEQDLAVIKKHMNELAPAFGMGSDSYQDSSSFTASAPEVRKNNINEDELTDMFGTGLGKAFNGLINNKDKKYITGKYNTKKRYKLYKTRKVDYVVIRPEEITFENSEDAELYPQFYSGYTGQWEICNNYGYLGTNNNDEPFYTWVKGGIAYYSTFPVDEKTGNPDKFIPDSQITPDLAAKAVFQMYRKAN